MQNQDIIKNAAHTMCQQLKAKGMPVTHSAMLEALAAGFGVDNWRKLKAVIDSPRKSAKKKVTPEPGKPQIWAVDALYTENGQPFTDSIQARTALEAAYLMMVERTTDYGSKLGICTVSDSAGEPALQPWNVNEYSLSPLREVLVEAHRHAKEATGLSEVEQDAVAWLGDIVDNAGLLDTVCSTWTDYESLKSMEFSYDFSEAAKPYSPGDVLTATKTLRMVCDALERSRGGVLKMEHSESLACYVHQLRGLCEYYAPTIDASTVGLTS